MPAVYLSTAYLAPVQYYCKMYTFGSVVIEACENYVKQTYRNRCLIVAGSGIQSLSVPVEKPQAGKCLTRDIRISEHSHWQQQHWHALVSAYGMSPFFEYYQDDFAPFYNRRYTFLFDFNEALREMICTLLDICPSVRYSTRYETSVPNDFRESIRPKRTVRDDTFCPRPYYQVFADRHGFLPDLSIADLLFNMGPESVLVMKK
ncbi:MAG: WbqC family protein [Tannerella sp.]|jgi:hypothetical protein|nr:WbqC family protein [Tannerella sp.]